jgi:hypothetical protein
MKFLKAVRLDVSDSRIDEEEAAAEDGEWAVSGGYAVCDLASGAHRVRALTSSVRYEHKSFVSSGISAPSSTPRTSNEQDRD